MIFGDLYRVVKSYFKSIDPLFFIFLLLILNISLPAKAFGLIVIYLFRFNIKNLFIDFKSNHQPRFYILMIALSVLGFVLNYKYWDLNYIFLTGFGLTFWLISALVLNQLQQAVDKLNAEKLHNTVTAFFVLNAIVSILNLVHIILITKSNPYTFTGMDLKYHTSTGDSITGVLFDFSSTNAIINIFGLFYFLYKRSFKVSALCLVVSLLTTSNTNTIFLIAALLVMIICNKDRLYKTIGIFYITMIIIFFAKVSPTNTEYVSKQLAPEKTAVTANLPGTHTPLALAKEEIKKKQTELFQKYYLSKVPKENRHIKNSIDSSVINALKKVQIREKEMSDVTDPKFNEQIKTKHENLVDYIKLFYNDSVAQPNEFNGKHYPGKLMSCIQTVKYCLSGIKPFFFGSGAGRFSSKAAFKACGIGTFGKYPHKFEYLSPEFLKNHLKIYCYFFNQDLSKHSVINTPFSVYNQLLGEYGVIGIVCFLLYYVWFFIKRFKHLSYGKYLLPLCLLFLIFDYWFEHLSIIIIFELLMLLDIKEQMQKKETEQALEHKK